MLGLEGWLLNTFSGGVVGVALQRVVSDARERGELKRAVRWALRAAFENQDVGKAEVLAEQLLDHVLVPAALPEHIMRTFAVDASLTPWSRLQMASKAAFEELDRIAAEVIDSPARATSQAEALGVDTNRLAEDFANALLARLTMTTTQQVGQLGLQLAIARTSEQVEGGLAAIQESLQELVAANRSVEQGALLIRFLQPLRPHAHDVSQIVETADSALTPAVRIEWPAFTQGLYRQLVNQQHRLRDALLGMPGVIPRCKSGLPDEGSLQHQMKYFADRFDYVTALKSVVTRRAATLPKRCVAARHSERQLALTNFLIIANAKLTSLMTEVQLRNEALSSEGIPSFSWPEILAAAPLRDTLGGGTEMLRRVEVTIAGIAERFSGAEIVTYAPGTVAASTTEGMFAEFVWPWAVPHVELSLAVREVARRVKNPQEPRYDSGCIGYSRRLDWLDGVPASSFSHDINWTTYDQIVSGERL